MGEAHLPVSKEEPTSKSRNTMSVSFKVTLSKGEDLETRRFLVGQDVASSLVYLKQKIATLFPALRRSEPVLSWVDEDGDEVAVASDEELKVALAALPGPVFKFRVRLTDTRKDGNCSGMACPKSAQAHPGVTCDGCEGPVVGPRYKCLTCPNSTLGNQNVHMLAGLLGGKPSLFWRLSPRLASFKLRERTSQLKNLDPWKKQRKIMTPTFIHPCPQKNRHVCGKLTQESQLVMRKKLRTK